jgi:ADP-ribose pyrophosphatase YjhB (NUDIX family)
LKRRRVVAYVTRARDGQTELLVFEDPKHPHTGTRVPAGRLDPDEELEAGLLREIAEETGLVDVRIVRELGCRSAPGCSSSPARIRAWSASPSE